MQNQLTLPPPFYRPWRQQLVREPDAINFCSPYNCLVLKDCLALKVSILETNAPRSNNDHLVRNLHRTTLTIDNHLTKHTQKDILVVLLLQLLRSVVFYNIILIFVLSQPGPRIKPSVVLIKWWDHRLHKSFNHLWLHQPL